MRSFGEYTNLVEIGRGGMASVYRATAPDGSLVALKLLAVHLAADPTARIRFEQESNLGLQHPNIVRVIRSGVHDDTPYIEMAYVPGQSLDRYILKHGPMTPGEVAPILNDAASALDYAHARGVVHRDVKPSNILIPASGPVLLADFGVAKAANVTAFTATSARVGSVFFMSPEQAAGTFEITKATDIYSLGVTIYYGLTGRHPFEGDNEIAIARQHIDRPPRHVSDVNPNVPRAVGDVVMWAMEKSPTRRPPSAGEFARSFQRALSSPDGPPPVPVPLPAPVTPTPEVAAAPSTTTLAQRTGLPSIVVLIIGLVGVCACAAMLVAVLPVLQPQPVATATPVGAQPGGLSVQTATPTSVPPSPESVLVPLTPEGQPVVITVQPIVIATTAVPLPPVIFPTQPPYVPPPPTPQPIWPTSPPIFPTVPIIFPTSTPFPIPPTLSPVPPPTPMPTLVPLPSPTPAPTLPPPPTATSAPPPTLPPPTIAPPPTPVPPTVAPPPSATPAVIVTLGP
jgi:serine/threonine-protein kinase